MAADHEVVTRGGGQNDIRCCTHGGEDFPVNPADPKVPVVGFPAKNVPCRGPQPRVGDEKCRSEGLVYCVIPVENIRREGKVASIHCINAEVERPGGTGVRARGLNPDPRVWQITERTLDCCGHGGMVQKVLFKRKHFGF